MPKRADDRLDSPVFDDDREAERTLQGIMDLARPDLVLEFLQAAKKVLRQNCTHEDLQKADRLLYQIEGQTIARIDEPSFVRGKM